MGRKKSERSGSKRTKKKSTTTAAPTPANDDAKRELFLHHRTAWNGWKGKQRAIDKIGDEIKKSLKKDGFTVQEFKIADELADQRGEIKVKSEVATRLRVARWIGHPLGAQLDMFASNTADIARDPRDEGKQASMENKPRKPPEEFAPGGKQEQEWLEGYADHQATLAEGFKPPNGTKGFAATMREQNDRVNKDIAETARNMGTAAPTHQTQQ